MTKHSAADEIVEMLDFYGKAAERGDAIARNMFNSLKQTPATAG